MIHFDCAFVDFIWHWRFGYPVDGGMARRIRERSGRVSPIWTESLLCSNICEGSYHRLVP